MPICKLFRLKRTCLLLFILSIHTCPILPLEHDFEHGHDVVAGDGDRVLELEDVSVRFADGLDNTRIDSIESVATAKSANHSFTNREAMSFLHKSTNKNTREIFRKAFSKALGGGITGAIAGIIQVLSLMWLVRSIIFPFLFFALGLI